RRPRRHLRLSRTEVPRRHRQRGRGTRMTTIYTVSVPRPHRTSSDLGLGLLRQPTTVLFGPGQRRQIPRLVEAIAGQVLMVTDDRMSRSVEFTEIVDGL